MGLDLNITGREVNCDPFKMGGVIGDGDKPNPDGTYPVHAVEFNIAWWRGWEHQPLCDYFAENFKSSGHAGYGMPSFADMAVLIRTLIGTNPEAFADQEQPCAGDGSYYFLSEEDFDKLLKDFAVNDALKQYVEGFEAARKWLNAPGTDRKIYFEVNC